jgi:hypothetical protein
LRQRDNTIDAGLEFALIKETDTGQSSERETTINHDGLASNHRGSW